MKKIYKTILTLALIGVGIGGFIWFVMSQPSTAGDQIIARSGLHWHATLSIVIDGVSQTIPTGVGLGATHNPIHTHEEDGVIHMEFSGMVASSDLKLGKFFELWNKKFSKDCIFDSCADETKQVRMLVNGIENLEFENYMMRDGDTIEIRYESR